MVTNLQKTVKLFLLVVGLLWLCAPSQTLAALNFANGAPQTFTDVNDRLAIFYGGSDALNQPVVSGPTNLTFNTSRLPFNTVLSIYGGGRSAMRAPNGSSTVQGDARVTVYNTKGNGVYGGGSGGGGTTAGAPSIVTGTAYLSIHNSEFVECFGAGIGRGKAQVGAVDMLIDHSKISFVFASESTGYGPQNLAIKGDATIKVINGSDIATLTSAAFNGNGHIGGNATIFVEDSTVSSVVGTLDSDVFGNLFMYLGKGTVIKTVAYFNRYGTIRGDALMVIDGATLKKRLIAGGDSSLRKGTVHIKNGLVNKLRVSSLRSNTQLYDMTVIMDKGHVNDFEFGMLNGILHKGTLVVNGGSIDKLTIGRDTPNQAETKIVETTLSSGLIKSLQLQKVTVAANLDFAPGRSSTIKAFNSTVREGFTNLNLQKGARTVWGTPNSAFNMKAKNVTFAGELVLAKGSNTSLEVYQNLTADGGAVTPTDLSKQQKTPVFALLGQANAGLKVDRPLEVNLNLSPGAVGGNGIPFAFTTGRLANPKLFAKENRKGIIWSDVNFDQKSGVWFLNNVQISKDYYAYSAAREASNWLRQRHASTAQYHALRGLLDHKDGLWVDLQGGYENVDVAVGKSKMPWVMASSGYSRLSRGVAFDAVYGFAFGFANGNHKWELSNQADNKIRIGALNAQAGLVHRSGAYAAASVQLAFSKIQTDNPGFSMKSSWKELVPTETLEFGWRCDVNEKFRLTPRTQLLLEQLSKHDFKFKYEFNSHDYVKLEKSFTATALFGVIADYKLSTTKPTDITIGLDVIKGLAGDYASQSKLFKKTFKDKNDSLVLRGTAECSVQLSDHFNMNLQVFGDVVNDSGFGGEIALTYSF